MALDIHLYLTTHADELPDLNSMKHTEEVRAWFSKVDDVAVNHDHFEEISEDIIKEAHPHPVLSAYSVVFYPPGKLLEADEVGEQFKALFLGHGKQFNWSVAPSPDLPEDKFDVYLEIIVGKEGDKQAEESRDVHASGMKEGALHGLSARKAEHEERKSRLGGESSAGIPGVTPSDSPEAGEAPLESRSLPLRSLSLNRECLKSRQLRNPKASQSRSLKPLPSSKPKLQQILS